MKKVLALALLGLAGAAVACDQQASVTDLDLTPSFAIWDYKVTGGGLMQSIRGTTSGKWLEVQVSAMDGDKGVTGQVEYTVYDRDGVTLLGKFHGQVDEFWQYTGDDGLTVIQLCGTMSVQEGTWFTDGSDFNIAILDDPEGDGLRQDSRVSGHVNCSSNYDYIKDGVVWFPAVMVDGDFRVKSDL